MNSRLHWAIALCAVLAVFLRINFTSSPVNAAPIPHLAENVPPQSDGTPTPTATPTATSTPTATPTVCTDCEEIPECPINQIVLDWESHHQRLGDKGLAIDSSHPLFVTGGKVDANGMQWLAIGTETPFEDIVNYVLDWSDDHSSSSCMGDLMDDIKTLCLEGVPRDNQQSRMWMAGCPRQVFRGGFNTDEEGRNYIRVSGNNRIYMDDFLERWGRPQIGYYDHSEFRSGLDMYYYLNKDCRFIPNPNGDDENQIANPCNEFTLRYYTSSPISLLWDKDVDLNAESKIAKFALLPHRKPSYLRWKASAKAPLLVIDPKRSGEVLSGAQLFGNWTWGGKKVASLDETSLRTSAWSNGFEALAQLDTNADGEVSGDELEELALWFDENQNAVSDAGEVKPLRELGVTALFYEVDSVDADTKDLVANVGYQRLVDGKLVTGAAVDWYAGSADSEFALIQEQQAREAFCKTESSFSTNASQDIDIDSDAEHSTDIEDINSISGLWSWRMLDGMTPRKRTEGYLNFIEENGNQISGISVAGIAVSTSKKAQSMMRVVALQGSKKSSAGANTIIEFSIDSEGQAPLRSRAELSADGKTLRGATEVRFKGDGKQANMTYSWIAKRM